MRAAFHPGNLFIYSFTAVLLTGCKSPHSTEKSSQSPDGTALVSDFEPCSGSPHGQTTTPSAGRAMIAWSMNGVDFHRPADPRLGLLIDRIGVPDAVVLPSGRILLYFVTGGRIYDGVFKESNEIAVAVSDRLAESGSWVFKEVHFTGMPAEYGTPVDPNVVLLPDGSVSLFASVFGNLGEDRHMGTAAYVSSDGGFTFAFRGLCYFGVIDPENYRFSNDNWQIITGEPGDAKGYAISTDGGDTFEPFGSFPDHLVVHESAATDRPGEYRAYVPTQEGVRSFISTAAPWTAWSPEPGYRLQLDASSGLESCHIRFPTVLRLATGRYLMVYETVIPGCGCEDDPVCD
jgi:hypothetical protein